ncbi:MAG: hypothetical protein J0M08_08310 [Bacteroidetes bacterium]|nr:hypothetical protein [Bacteroidota bacterium]
MNRSIADTIARILFIVSGYLTIFLILVLGYFNRFASDDFTLLYLLNNYGVWDGMLAMYHNWSTYWAFYLIILPFVKLLIYVNNLLPYSILLVATTVITFYRLFIVLESELNFELSKAKKIHSAIFLTASFFWISLDKGQSWFWIFCSTEYTWSAIIVVLLFTFLIEAKNSAWRLAVIALLSIIIGGSAVPVFIFYCFLMGLLLLFYKNKISITKIGLSLVLFSISVAITILGEGSGKRQQMLPSPSIVIAVKMLTIHALQITKAYWQIGIIGLFCTLIGWQSISPIKNNLTPVYFKSNYLFAFLLILIFLVTFPAAYLLSDVPPMRIWGCIYISLAISLVLFSISIKKQNKIVRLTAAIFFVLFVCYNIITQFVIVKKYSAAYDSRMNYILMESKNTKTLLLEPLPPAGMLYSAEINTDSTHFTNRQLKMTYQIDLNLKRK